MSSGPRTTNLK
uniref:Uncharacterized protein n=1 Tax=Anguilla anguilla TaxID=7936 RepID=A0A0E9T2I4_ANGAN